TTIPISRSIEFGENFPNEIKDKTQLQRVLGCVNYIAEFIPNIRIICAPLYKRLRKNPPKWNNEMTQILQKFLTKFLIHTDCKAAPSVLTKDVQILVSKHIFASEHIKGKHNFLPDFLTREFLHDKQKSKIQYGPLLGSNKIEINSSSTSTGPTSSSLGPNYQNPLKSQYSLAQILKNPIPRPTNPLVSSSNRFTPLYFNTITGPKSQLITSIPEPLTNQYVDKPELLSIMTLESYTIKEDIKTLIVHIFAKTFNYLPNNLLKTQRFYEFILVDIDSAENIHTRDDQGNILFSNMKIMNILSPQDWDQPLFDSKSFSRSFNPTGYTYYDYIDVWYNTLYINPEKHSWFV
ncbi:hypothetical protein CR513_07789, partial [Mucuna pruriens]